MSCMYVADMYTYKSMHAERREISWGKHFHIIQESKSSKSNSPRIWQYM